MEVSVLSNLRVNGAITLENIETFPPNPRVGMLAIKGELLYAYLNLKEVVNWYPLLRLPERYVHSQTSPSMLWTVTHNLNKQEVWYQVQDSNGQLTFASEFTEVDSNTFTLAFSEPMQGKVLVLGTGLDGIQPYPEPAPAQSVSLADISDWPADVTAQELGYLDGLTGSIQAQLDALAASSSAPETLENKTLSNVVISGAVTEEIFTISGTAPVIDPTNGTIQTWTLSGNSAPTISMADGQSLTIMINDGTSYTITWPTVLWVGGSAPTLAATGQTVVVFWKVAGVVYGSRVGDV